MTSGALTFARYAYPPNALGYCGPADSAALLGYADADATDDGLVDLARQFSGAWPYLTLIGAANGRPDPLDAGVVEAYWLGNPLLEQISPTLLAAHLQDRFSDRAGRHWTDLATLAVCGGRAHHNFHVFAVYPWVGMLRAGFDEDRCGCSIRAACGGARWPPATSSPFTGTGYVRCSPHVNAAPCAATATRSCGWSTKRSRARSPPPSWAERRRAAARAVAPAAGAGRNQPAI